MIDALLWLVVWTLESVARLLGLVIVWLMMVAVSPRTGRTWAEAAMRSVERREQRRRARP